MPMLTDRAVFLEVIEWFDSTGQEIVHRVPEKGSAEIKFGAQLTVRESQVAVFLQPQRIEMAERAAVMRAALSGSARS